jgi:hypothetical protein
MLDLVVSADMKGSLALLESRGPVPGLGDDLVYVAVTTGGVRLAAADDGTTVRAHVVDLPE